MKIPDTPGIYVIICVLSKKAYVGQAHDLYYRITEHKRLLRYNRHPNAHLQASYNKNGAEAFTYTVLELVPLLANLVEREQAYMDLFSSTHTLYNVARAGEHARGHKLSDETRARMRAGHIGLKHSAEHCAAISRGKAASYARSPDALGRGGPR